MNTKNIDDVEGLSIHVISQYVESRIANGAENIITRGQSLFSSADVI